MLHNLSSLNSVTKQLKNQLSNPKINHEVLSTSLMKTYCVGISHELVSKVVVYELEGWGSISGISPFATMSRRALAAT
jgi:hypothetical protein